MLAPAMACCPALLTAAPRRRRGGLSAAGAPGSLLAAAPPRPPFPQALPQFLELRTRRLQFLFQPLLSLYRLAMHSAVIARLPALLYYLAPQLGYLAPACRRVHPSALILEDRHARASTLMVSQLPVSSWHEVIGEPTIADAICDRIVHGAHRINLEGDSIRKLYAERANRDTVT